VRPAGKPENLLRANLRRWLLIAAGAVTIFRIFHHVDHVVRGNHSGWSFQEAVTPFTFSLLIYALLVPGLYLTWRGHLVAGYWLFTAAVLFVVVTSPISWEHSVRRRYETSMRSTMTPCGAS
jgi:Zn-dependent membrane protease YugP